MRELPIESKTFEFFGVQVTAEIHSDEFQGWPWDQECGHGVVNEKSRNWERGFKQPGEVIIFRDRWKHVTYDFEATIKQAREEGWGLSEQEIEKLAIKLGRRPTKKDCNAHAVRLDLEYCQAWLNGKYTWALIRIVDQEGETLEAVGGFEYSLMNHEDNEAYIWEQARVMAEHAAEQLKASTRFQDAMACGV